jgi:hypothetical protein
MERYVPAGGRVPKSCSGVRKTKLPADPKLMRWVLTVTISSCALWSALSPANPVTPNRNVTQRIDPTANWAMGEVVSMVCVMNGNTSRDRHGIPERHSERVGALPVGVTHERDHEKIRKRGKATEVRAAPQSRNRTFRHFAGQIDDVLDTVAANWPELI